MVNKLNGNTDNNRTYKITGPGSNPYNKPIVNEFAKCSVSVRKKLHFHWVLPNRGSGNKWTFLVSFFVSVNVKHLTMNSFKTMHM